MIIRKGETAINEMRNTRPGAAMRWLLPILILMMVMLGIVWWKRTVMPPRTIDVSSEAPAAQEVSRAGLALAQAGVWSADAVLAKLSSSVDGADTWIYEFGSASMPGKIFRVTIGSNTVQSTAEVDGVVSGGVMPNDIISSDEAIAKAHAIPGYEQVQVMGVEMIYGPDGKQWYWGVKTNRGVVSIKAKK